MQSKQHEAMKLALEALEKLNNTNSHWWQEVDKDVVVQLNNAESALREALAQERSSDEQPAQRTWAGLSDDEIAQGCQESWVTEEAWQSAVWWAEVKLKEKNT